MKRMMAAIGFVFALLAAPYLPAQSAAQAMTFREFDGLGDDDQNAALMRAVDEVVLHEETDPKIAGAVWGFFYPELVTYVSDAPKPAKEGRTEFWEQFLNSKERGELDKYVVNESCALPTRAAHVPPG